MLALTFGFTSQYTTNSLITVVVVYQYSTTSCCANSPLLIRRIPSSAQICNLGSPPRGRNTFILTYYLCQYYYRTSGSGANRESTRQSRSLTQTKHDSLACIQDPNKRLGAYFCPVIPVGYEQATKAHGHTVLMSQGHAERKNQHLKPVPPCPGLCFVVDFVPSSLSA